MKRQHSTVVMSTKPVKNLPAKTYLEIMQESHSDIMARNKVLRITCETSYSRAPVIKIMAVQREDEEPILFTLRPLGFVVTQETKK